MTDNLFFGDLHLTLREKEDDPIVLPRHSPGAFRPAMYGGLPRKDRDHGIHEQDPEDFGAGIDSKDEK